MGLAGTPAKFCPALAHRPQFNLAHGTVGCGSRSAAARTPKTIRTMAHYNDPIAPFSDFENAHAGLAGALMRSNLCQAKRFGQQDAKVPLVQTVPSRATGGDRAIIRLCLHVADEIACRLNVGTAIFVEDDTTYLPSFYKVSTQGRSLTCTSDAAAPRSTRHDSATATAHCKSAKRRRRHCPKHRSPSLWLTALHRSGRGTSTVGQTFPYDA